MRFVNDSDQTALVDEHTFYMINVWHDSLLLFTHVSSLSILYNIDKSIASISYYMQPKTGPLIKRPNREISL